MQNLLGNSLRLILCVALFSLSAGCEFFYDPSFIGEAPGSPGSEWRGEEIVYPCKQTEKPYTVGDLSSTMSVTQLLDIALFNNPSTRASWNAARAAAYAYRVSLSEYFPTINYFSTLTAESDTIGGVTGSVNSSATPLSSLSTTGAITNVGTGASVTSTSSASTTPSTHIDTYFNELTASWLMLDFGGRDAQADLAFQTLIAANWEHNFTMQQVLMSVLNAYTSYIGNKALVAADETNLKDAQVTLEAAQVMRNAGLATLTDVLQTQSVVEQARMSLIQAQGAEKTAFADLMIALGLPPETKMNVQDLPQQLPVIELMGDVNSFLELAKQKRPDIGAAIAAVKQQEAQLTISYSAGMPTLTAN